ncbi:MAG: carbohydrate kinase family protein [Anaerolineales bacterium]|nr:MAG: carbohydrate kinase family protein [Anaerolineales bacterium]
MKVIVTGSVAFDYLMKFPGRFAEHILPDQIEHLSVSFLVDEMRRQRGGCAANISYNLGLLGEKPRLMATVGQDFEEYASWLEQHGVDTALVRREPDLFTASFFVSTDVDGNQIASFYTGAMARARELSLHSLGKKQVDLVVISPNDPEAMVVYAAECHDLGLAYLYDPSQQIVRLSGDDLRSGLEGCDLLVVNEYESGMLQEKTGLTEEEIQSAPRQAYVVTLGAQGTRIWSEGSVHEIPVVPPLQVDDPTGVGDAFRAGLIKGLALGLAWPLAGRIGALAATYPLETRGPQGQSYTPAEFVSRFREHFDDEGQLDALAATS